MRKTQKAKVLQVWVRLQSVAPKRFVFPYEVIGQMGSADFVGYKAPTRFCELCLEYPSLVESKMEGKYRVGRLRFENSAEFLKELPSDLATVMRDTMKECGVSVKRERMVPVQVELPDGTRAVRLEKRIVEE